MWCSNTNVSYCVRWRKPASQTDPQLHSRGRDTAPLFFQSLCCARGLFIIMITQISYDSFFFFSLFNADSGVMSRGCFCFVPGWLTPVDGTIISTRKPPRRNAGLSVRDLTIFQKHCVSDQMIALVKVCIIQYNIDDPGPWRSLQYRRRCLTAQIYRVRPSTWKCLHMCSL